MGNMLLHVNAGTKRKKNTPSLLRESPEIGLKCHQEAQFEDLPFQPTPQDPSAGTAPPDPSAHHLLQAWRHPKVSHSL